MKARQAPRSLGTSLLISGLSALAVGWFVWLDLERVSPGGLARSHEQVQELASNGGCVLCHGDAARGMAGACLECHAPIDAQLATGKGLHGGLAQAQDCARCHAEHHGESFPIVSDFSFALSGADSANFDHGHTDFGLDGRHTTLGCQDCHQQALAQVLAAGQLRFLGLSQQCSSCHEDVHGQAFGDDCAFCHGQEHSFPEAAGFQHELLRLRGAHERGCAACHEDQQVASLVATLRAARTPEVRDCQQCHQSPHRAMLSESEALEGGACQTCHDAERAAFHGSAALLEPEQHAAWGFSLAAPHAELECQQCHQGWGNSKDTAAFARAYPGRGADECQACHGDPHDGQFASARLGRACLDCHEQHRFAPSRIDERAHALVFPLEQAHAALRCEDCHQEQAGARVFVGLDRQCAACHQDPHGSQFATASQTDCAACHGTGHFGEVDFGPETHARLGFPLSSPHAQADCGQCHGPDPLLAGLPRFRPTPDACAACHQDPHQGQFDGPEGPADCRRCHDDAHFLPPHYDFTAHAQSGFPLEGAHQAVACNLCHTNEPGSPRQFQGTASACAACHQDPHGGVFAGQPQLGGTDCARCHQNDSFAGNARVGFEHAWTGYALEGAHETAACAACHAPRARPDALGRSYQPAPGTRCQDCHSDPHAGQFGGPAQVDCRRCHTSTLSFATLRFDHNRDARFALDTTHEDLACAACHQPTALEGGGQAVRYRPLGQGCADCHSTGRNE